MNAQPQDVSNHFEGRSPKVRQIYDRLLDVAGAFGPVEEDPKKTSIHLNRKTAFAGVATRKESLILTLKSACDLQTSRIAKHEQVSANRWHLEVKLADPADVDPELIGWLKAAYEISG
ncbi:MAG: DUF5655 domain-containing protein [Thermoanaerobaculia bacterium]